MMTIFAMSYFSSIISGQYLPSSAGPPDRVTVCQGANTFVSCDSDSIIAVADIQFGTKLTTTCGLGSTAVGCCDYDGADCNITYSGTLERDLCNGRQGCFFGNSVSAVETNTLCDTNYPDINHYLTMEYYCLLGKL